MEDGGAFIGAAVRSGSPGSAEYELREGLFVVARDPRLIRALPVLWPFMHRTA